MSLMSFRRSRVTRLVAGLTLCSFLSGCLPATVAPSQEQKGQLRSANDFTGNLLASLNSVTQSAGVALPGARNGGELRQWSTDDQAAAERAKAAFDGKEIDGLEVYDPGKPGEAARYQQRIKAVYAKYGQKKALSEAEFKEVSEAVVPVLRFLVKSRTYRAAQSAAKPTRSANGDASVSIPAGSTVEMALLTYCNDHGLPAPWAGEKLQLRASDDYMPPSLLDLYRNLHRYAGTHPDAHYAMQNTVWWLRDNGCEMERLTQKQKQIIEAAQPGGLNVLTSYCTTEKFKKQAFASAKGYLPGSARFGEYQQLLAKANDLQSKADAFLAADLSNPAEVLQLAQTAGFSLNTGKSDFLANPYLKSAMPLLKNSPMARALTPASTDDRAVEASLAVMEQLGATLGAQATRDSGSLADYSDLGGGLYARTQHNGGARSASIRLINTSDAPITFDNTRYVLTTVNDPQSERSRYTPTQRLSIGPMAPVSVQPNGNGKAYTPKNEKDAIDALSPLKDAPAGWGLPPTEPKPADSQKDCTDDFVMKLPMIGLGIIRDVVQTLPVIGNIAYAYNAWTGNDWATGAKLSTTDRMIALVSAVIPVSGAVGALRVAGKTVKTVHDMYDLGGAVAYGASAGIKAREAYAEFTAGNGCAAVSAASAALANGVCVKAGGSFCRKATAAMAVTGGVSGIDLAQVDMDKGALPGSVKDVFNGATDALGSGMKMLQGLMQ